VTLTSSSPAGTFSTTTAGPWTSTLTLPISPGSGVVFYYLDTRAGPATLTAAAPGTTQAVAQVTVVAGAAARIAVTPATREVRARGETTFTAAVTDSFGNATAGGLTWSVTPPSLGTFVRRAGNAVAFRAGRALGPGTVTAAANGGTLTAAASVTVRPATLRIGAVTFRGVSRGIQVSVGAIDGARRPVSRASLTIVTRVGDQRLGRARVVTGAAGKGRLLVRARPGCYSILVTRAVAEGFTWNGKTPRNRFCRR
jgi:hypothetical protein